MTITIKYVYKIVGYITVVILLVEMYTIYFINGYIGSTQFCLFLIENPFYCFNIFGIFYIETE